VERPNGRRRDQLRALLRTSLQENISGADPGNHNNPLATEQEDQAGRGGERQGTEAVADLQALHTYTHTHTHTHTPPHTHTHTRVV